ncbi:MAG TPA: glycosyltransferase family 4 protein [Gemmatimonadaceae bacterium]|nr:glycosyltransferase family 4 protein [Gemmatimonadaceae bacterium]
MARICVITQDIRLGGGVLAKLTGFLRFAASRGHACDVYYPAERPSTPDVIARLRQISSVADVYPVPVFEAVPHFVRAQIFRERCRLAGGYDAYQLVSGPLGHALPFVRRALPFVAWIAGPLRAEVEVMPRRKLRHYYLYNPLTLHLYDRQESTCGQHAITVLVDSRYSARNIERYLGVGPDTLDVLPNPIDTERFRPAATIARPRYVVSVSRLMRGKGFPTLLRAFQRVAARDDEIELHIAGDGPDRAGLEQLTHELGLERRVVFRGALRDERLIAEYAGASLFALASHHEGLPTVVLEAMACGLPVVSTACGGPADHVVPGETGFLTPVGDSSAMAERMLTVLRDRGLAERMGRAARQRAIDTFSTEIINERLDAVYARAFGIERQASRSPSIP